MLCVLLRVLSTGWDALLGGLSLPLLARDAAAVAPYIPNFPPSDAALRYFQSTTDLDALVAQMASERSSTSRAASSRSRSVVAVG